MGEQPMDANDIHVHGRGISIKRMVSDKRTRSSTNQLDVLRSLHLQLDGEQVELWVCGYELCTILLATSENKLSRNFWQPCPVGSFALLLGCRR